MIDWAEFSSVFGAVGPTVVALAVVILNRRDRLADKVHELSAWIHRWGLVGGGWIDVGKCL